MREANTAELVSFRLEGLLIDFFFQLFFFFFFFLIPSFPNILRS